jgi:16S rRNA processing protein RimM
MGLKHVGKVMDAHGIRGDIYCLVFSGDVSWVGQLDNLNLKLKGQSHLFEIIKLKEFKRGFIATLKNFDNRNKAEEFKGAELWVDENLFVSEDGDSMFLSEVLDFELQDVRQGVIGKIVDFSSNGMQDLLVVKSNKSDKIFEIPFVQDFVTDIDFKTKKMTTSLPEGLLEINEED